MFDDDSSYEKIQCDRARYLRGVGMKKRLEQSHGISASFVEKRGETRLKLSGPQTKLAAAREMIKTEPGFTRWYSLPINALKVVKGTKHSDVIQRLKDNRICVGWSVSLKTSKLFVHGRNIDNIESGLCVFLTMVGLAREDIEQPKPATSHQALQRSGVDSSPVRNKQPARRTGSLDRRSARAKPLIDIQFKHDMKPLVPPLPIPEVSTRIEDLDMEKLAFLRATKADFVRSMKAEFHVNIDVDSRKSYIEFAGATESNVNRAKQKAQDYLDGLCIKSVERSPEFISCLKEVKHQDIIESLKKAQVRVGWDIRGKKLWICGDNKPKVEKAEEVICEQVVEGVYPEGECLNESQRQLIRSATAWRTQKDKLISENPGLNIGCTSDFSKIVFAARDKDVFHTVVFSLDTFFSPLKVVTGKVFVSDDLHELLHTYRSYVEKRCQPSFDQPVALEVIDQACVVKSLSSRSINFAEAILKAFDVCKREVEVEWRVQISWLRTEEGVRRKFEIGRKSRTLVTTVTESKCRAAENPVSVRANSIVHVSDPSGQDNKLEILIGDLSEISKEVLCLLNICLHHHRHHHTDS